MSKTKKVVALLYKGTEGWPVGKGEWGIEECTFEHDLDKLGKGDYGGCIHPHAHGLVNRSDMKGIPK